MHVAPHGAVGIVLEVEVVLAVLIHQAVGVVHPAVGGRVVVDGAEHLAVGYVEGVGQFEVLPGQCLLRQTANDDGVAALAAQGEGHGVVDLIHGQTHVHGHVAQHDLCLRLAFLDGEQQVAGLAVDVGHREGVALMCETYGLALLGAGAEGEGSCGYEAGCEGVRSDAFHGIFK